MASPNFIMENANSFRATNFNSNLQYDIGELNFYISAKTLSNHQVFLVMKNEKNLDFWLFLSNSYNDFNTLFAKMQK